MANGKAYGGVSSQTKRGLVESGAMSKEEFTGEKAAKPAAPAYKPTKTYTPTMGTKEEQKAVAAKAREKWLKSKEKRGR